LNRGLLPDAVAILVGIPSHRGPVPPLAVAAALLGMLGGISIITIPGHPDPAHIAWAGLCPDLLVTKAVAILICPRELGSANGGVGVIAVTTGADPVPVLVIKAATSDCCKDPKHGQG
jgi:hypothetical protein